MWWLTGLSLNLTRPDRSEPSISGSDGQDASERFLLQAITGGGGARRRTTAGLAGGMTY